MKRIVEVKSIGYKKINKSFCKVTFEFQEEIKCLMLKKTKRKVKKLKVKIRNNLDELTKDKIEVLSEVNV